MPVVKLALIHDWLNQLGGAEDVLETLHAMYPAAPVYTSIYDRARMPVAWRGWDIRATWLDRMPAIHRRHQPYMPLFAALWARYTIPAEFDTLLSNKSAFCIGARGLNPRARHICYCLTPTRFTYDFDSYRQRERIPAATIGVLNALNAALRRWETRAAQRVDTFIAISRDVQARIKALYGRESTVIFPPVSIPDEPAPDGQHDGFFLIASRLLPYKRVDLAIEACARVGAQLIIAGDGRDRPRLEALAQRQRGANIKLIGRVDDAALNDLFKRCKAFIFPGFEDFGIAPVRAMAYGKPVVAYARGGALDTVVDGKTGVLFGQQSVEALVSALEKLSVVVFSAAEIREHARSFSTERFVAELRSVIATPTPGPGPGAS
jgi:glycosyltransferase involved in cell wall biosynthesis